MTTVVVGVLALATWFLSIVLKSYLSSPHTFGTVTITPLGYDPQGFLTHHYDALIIENESFAVSITNFNLDITLFDEDKGVKVGAEEIGMQLKANKEAPKKTAPQKMGKLEFPSRIKFYLPTQIEVGKVSVITEDQKQWATENLSITSEGSQKVNLKVQNISGEHVAQKANLNMNIDFSSSNVDVQASVKAEGDSVYLAVNAPKDDLTKLNTQAELNVKDPSQWLPFEWPQNAPALGALNVSAKTKIDVGNPNPKYNVTIKTSIGEFWPLKALDALINLNGDLKNINANVTLQNKEGGVIHVEGSFDDKFNGTMWGSVKNMSAQFGPQMMPLDATIHSAEKIGNKMDVSIETPQGSQIETTLNFEDGFSLTYTADISPYEPWAIDWSRGSLTLGPNTKIYGSFSTKEAAMRALVKFDSIPNAYNITADSMQLVLVLNKDSITFHNGIIHTPKAVFDFTGCVSWYNINPHTAWKVTQRSGGEAEVFITIIDSTTINAVANQVQLSTIPLTLLKLNEKLDGYATGHWFQNFDTNVGEAQVSVNGEFKPFQFKTNLKAHQNGDTVFFEKVEALQNQNKVEAEAIFILANDSNPNFKPTGTLPVQVVHAWASTDNFSIPLLLEPINDTTFASGQISGDIAYNEIKGLQGNINFTDLEFSNIPPQLFNIKKMNLFAEQNKAELNAYLGIGNGGWTGNTQVIVDDIFSVKRHVSWSHSSDNGGTLWAEGFVDTSITFKGQVNANGSWFIPGTLSEITKTDLKIDVQAKIKEGLRGIEATIHSDTTVYKPPKFNVEFPIRIHGNVKEGIVDITEISTQNDSGESIFATLQYNMNDMLLKAIDIKSDHYSIIGKNHKLVAENISGHLEETDNELIVSALFPSLKYTYDDQNKSTAEVLGNSKLNFIIPHSREGFIQNKSIQGEVSIDKMVYNKELDIEVTPAALSKYTSMFNNFITKLRKKEAQEAKLSNASPIDLSLHISDSQKDSIQITTPFATFPFTFDAWILGNTLRPIVRGDLTNSNTGFVGVKKLYEFDLNSFRVTWNDVPWQNGALDISSTQELPYCTTTEINEDEKCPINLDIQGTITNPQAIPSSNCGNESSSAAIYYNIFLGCIAENTSENTDWNKLAGKAIGKVLSTTANRTLGGEYIGDIDMKVMLFENTSTNEKDSSYFKVPISLDRWVKDLSLVFGYTQDQSNSPTYDQALQFGVNYTLPVFQDSSYSHKNHLSPNLSLNGMLISKQYITSTGAEQNEQHLEKNVGVNYSYRYWNPCLLGIIGKCETSSTPEEAKQENKK